MASASLMISPNSPKQGRRQSEPWHDRPPAMQTRPLGRTGLNVAPLILGGHVFGWTADEATSGRVLDRFVDQGFNLIDTADIYGWYWMKVAGLSESILGRWLRRSGKRSRVLIATKV